MYITFKDDLDILSTGHPDDLHEFFVKYVDMDWLLSQLACDMGNDYHASKIWRMKTEELVSFAEKEYLGGLGEILEPFFNDNEEFEWWNVEDFEKRLNEKRQEELEEMEYIVKSERAEEAWRESQWAN